MYQINTTTHSEDENKVSMLDPPPMRSVMAFAAQPIAHPFSAQEPSNNFYEQSVTKKEVKNFDETVWNPDVLVTSAPCLLAPPAYVEPHNCFRSACQPNALWATLQKVMLSLQIDYELNLAKSQLKCVTYQGGSALHFRVFIYKDERPGTVLVEFQRRRGCVVKFNQVYQNILVQIGQSPLAGPKKMGLLDVMPPLPETEEEDIFRSTKMLMEMATTPQVDIQRQGCQGLVQLLSQQLPTTLLEDPRPLVALCASLLQSNDEDIVHSAAVLLHELLEKVSGYHEISGEISISDPLEYCHCKKEVLTLVPSLFSVLKWPLHYANTDTKRFVTAFILRLVLTTEECKSLLRGASELASSYRDILSQLRQCGDEKVRTNVVGTLQLISGF